MFKRLIGASTALLLGLGLVAGAVLPASADDAIVGDTLPTSAGEETPNPSDETTTPTDEPVVVVEESAKVEDEVKEPDVGYRLVLWQADTIYVLWPQHYLADEVQAIPDLDGLDEFATCGTYQADLYRDDADTAALIAGGVLTGPSQPLKESWPGDGYKPSYAKQWTVTSGCPKPPTTSSCPATTGVKITDLSTMLFEDRTGGSHTLTSTGLDLAWHGPDLTQSKSAGYILTDFALSDAGSPSLDYTVTTGASAGLNLTLYVNGAWKGNLVLEPLFSKYWINKPIPGLPAGPNPGYQLAYGTLDEIIAAYFSNGVTDLRIKAVGYSGGSGSEGTGTVNSITAGCTVYTFGTPTAPPVSPPAVPELAATGSKNVDPGLLIGGLVLLVIGGISLIAARKSSKASVR